MLTSLLGYVVLGLALALPLWRLLLWLGVRSGLYRPEMKYLRTYVPAPQRAAPDPSPDRPADHLPSEPGPAEAAP